MDAEGITVVYGDVCLRKQRRKRQKLLIIEQLYDFAKNTTLHGLRYITDRELYTVEKIFWLITFLASTVYCFILIHNVWIKWTESPVFVTVSEDLIPVEEVPFPSITICPQTKSVLKYYNYTQEKTYFEDQWKLFDLTLSVIERLKMFEDISMVCDNSDTTFIFKPADVYTSRNYSDESLVQHIKEVSPLQRDIFILCRWHNSLVDCDQLFRTVLTQEGVCFNMNALAAEEMFHQHNIHKKYVYLDTHTHTKGWTLSDGYQNNESDPFPRRGRENGAQSDLSVFFIEDTRRDSLCNALSAGFKVFIHHPTDYPQTSLYSLGIMSKHVTSMAIRYSILNTPEKLRSYSADVRKCYFSNERQLKFFHVYTANNCRIECLTNYTFQLCGCVGFHMPYNDSSRICSYNKMNCMRKAQEKYAQHNHSDENFKPCNCLPACNTIDYDAEIFQTRFNMKEFLKLVSKYPQDTYDHLEYSKLDVYFKNPRSVSMRRSELFGTTDFLANCGGLLGLFLGFSFLSLVEIFYFVTLRLWCMLKRDLKEEKKNRAEQAKRVANNALKVSNLPLKTISQTKY